MNLCSNDHDEICHEGHDCPFCAMRKEKDERIEELERELGDAIERINQLESEAT
jgi:hypothetical protein